MSGPGTTWRGRDRAGAPLVVREAVPRDAPRLMDHVRVVVEETEFMLQSSHDALPDLADHRALIDQLGHLPNCLSLVATRGDRRPGRAEILGNLTLLGGQSSRIEHVAVLGMGVQRAVWSRGVGGRLLDVAIAWAAASAVVASISLQVYASNLVARGLYRSRGFVEEGTMAEEVALTGRWEDLVGMSLDVWGPS